MEAILQNFGAAWVLADTRSWTYVRRVSLRHQSHSRTWKDELCWWKRV